MGLKHQNLPLIIRRLFKMAADKAVKCSINIISQGLGMALNGNEICQIIFILLNMVGITVSNRLFTGMLPAMVGNDRVCRG